MYISYQGQQAMHQDVVNDALRRSEQRRMLKAMKRQDDSRARAWNPGIAMRALVCAVRGAGARP